MLGTIHQLRNTDDEAIRAFNEVLTRNPRVASVQARLAELQLRKGAAPAVVPFAEQPVGARPDGMVERLVLARTIAAKGDLALAESLLVTLLAERPDLVSLHEQLGRVKLSRQDTAGARQAFTRAVELDVNAVGAQRGLLVLDIDEKNLAGARRRIEAAIAAGARQHRPAAPRRGVYAAGGDLAQQERILRRVIEIDPAKLEAFATLAAVYARTGRLEDARVRFEALAGAAAGVDCGADDGRVHPGDAEEAGRGTEQSTNTFWRSRRLPPSPRTTSP